MARIALEFLIPILLPTAVYFLWLVHEQRRIERLGRGEAPRWQDAPWLWLAIAGAALTLVVAFAVALFGGDRAGSGYVPPRAIDGQIVPGHRVTPEQPAAPGR
jgi:hypothetical protein